MHIRNDAEATGELGALTPAPALSRASRRKATVLCSASFALLLALSACGSGEAEPHSLVTPTATGAEAPHTSGTDADRAGTDGHRDDGADGEANDESAGGTSGTSDGPEDGDADGDTSDSGDSGSGNSGDSAQQAGSSGTDTYVPDYTTELALSVKEKEAADAAVTALEEYIAVVNAVHGTAQEDKNRFDSVASDAVLLSQKEEADALRKDGLTLTGRYRAHRI